MKRTQSLGGVLPAVVFVVAAVCAAAVSAATFPNLYRVTVVPEAGAEDARAAATRQAMARLLIRVTGDRSAPLDPQLAAMIEDPSRYLNSYGLDRQGRAQVGFNANLVDQALSALSRPVWGPERPLTVLWVAVDNGAGERALLGANELTVNELGVEFSDEMRTLAGDLKRELLAVADERGLPVVLPLLDIEDMTAVSFTDVWGGFEEPVLAASQRYGADAVLIGRVRPGAFGNEVQWLLLQSGRRDALGGVTVRDGLDAAADRFAAELSVVGGASTARLSVQGVDSPADYARVVSYLETLSVLQSVDVESYDRGVLTLRVAARGDSRVLERVLSFGGVLEPAGAFPASGAPATELVFRVEGAGSGL
jgi:hypothetical protein